MAETNSNDLPLIDEQVARDFLAEMEYSDNVMHFGFNLDAETEFVERNAIPSIILHWAYRLVVTSNVAPLPENFRDRLFGAEPPGDKLRDVIVRHVHFMCRVVVRERLGMRPLDAREISEFMDLDPIFRPVPAERLVRTEATLKGSRSAEQLNQIAKVLISEYPDIAKYIYLMRAVAAKQGYTGLRRVTGSAVEATSFLFAIERSLFGNDGQDMAHQVFGLIDVVANIFRESEGIDK